MKTKITAFVLILMLMLSMVPMAATEYTETPLWEYEVVGGFHNGLAYVKKDGKYGNIDTSGNLVIPCIFDQSLHFYDGIAIIDTESGQQFFDTSGNLLFTTNYLYVENFSEGMAVVWSRDNKYGYIDKTGKEVIPCKYNGALEFRHGVAPTTMGGGQYDIIDKAGNVLFTCYYDAITAFYDGLARVNVKADFAFINTKGEEVTPFYDSAEVFYNGLASVLIDNKRGFINTKGELVVSNVYRAVNNFGAEFTTTGYSAGYRDGVWKCIDEHGNELFDFPYTKYSPGIFSGKYAMIRNDEDKRGIIDINGNIVVPCIYDSLTLFEGNCTIGDRDGVSYLITIYDSPEVGVLLNGKRLSFTKQPKIVDGRTIVPLRTIFEAMEAKVDWDDATQSITVSRGSDVISFQIGNNVMTRNGQTITLDVPPQLLVDTTFVPVRAISEAFSYNVQWDEVNYDVIIAE